MSLHARSYALRHYSSPSTYNLLYRPVRSRCQLWYFWHLYRYLARTRAWTIWNLVSGPLKLFHSWRHFLALLSRISLWRHWFYRWVLAAFGRTSFSLLGPYLLILIFRRSCRSGCSLTVELLHYALEFAFCDLLHQISPLGSTYKCIGLRLGKRSDR